MAQDIQQLREEFKQKLSRLNDYLWTAGLQNPVARIEQISYFFFLKMLEEQDIAMDQEERITGRKHKSIFAGKNEKFRWSAWRDKTGKDLERFVRDEIFPFIEGLQNGHTSIGDVFHEARLLIPDPVTLKKTVEVIDTIDFSNLDSDIKGDLYEGLLNSIDAAGELGQFLTPRHIIRAIIEMVNPKIGDTVYDPACGTGGFLISAFEYIKRKNSDPKNTEERNGKNVYLGDKLSDDQWKFLTNKTFFGSDVDIEMRRLALMNLILHGIEGAHLKRRDTVAGTEDEDDLRKFDVILTNPPFAGKVDKERIKGSLPVKSKKTQVLFLGHVINSLNAGKRAGIILPEGSLFGTNKDDVEIRRYLLEHTELEAVVSMPGGVFQPYAGVKTSFLIFKKKPAPKLNGKEKIWYFDMQGDGSSLSAAKKFGPQYRNDLPKLLELWPERQAAKPFSWLTSVKDIVENEYILSANTYNPYSGEEEKEYREPREILEEIKRLDEVLTVNINKITKAI
jgi:type I restriction enzyme M protein